MLFDQKNSKNNGNLNEFSYESLVKLQRTSNSVGNSTSVTDRELWQQAWNTKQQYKLRVRLDHTEPMPLIIDKISSYPVGSLRRLHYEDLKGVMENTTSSKQSCLENLTRESYRSLQRITKVSLHMQRAMFSTDSSGDVSTKSVFFEQGNVVANNQSAFSYISNALQDMSDAIGSHADVNSYLYKNAQGPIQLLPQHVYSSVYNVYPQFAEEVEVAYRSAQKSMFLFSPSKEAGSLRHLLTSKLSVINVPFDLVSDSFMGLSNVLKQIGRLLDTVQSFLLNMFYSTLGLYDGLMVFKLIQSFILSILGIANTIAGLFDFISGFFGQRQIINGLLRQDFIECGAEFFNRSEFSINAKNRPNPFAKASEALKNFSNKASGTLGKINSLSGGFNNLIQKYLNPIQSKISGLVSAISHAESLTNLNLGGMLADALLNELHSICCTGTVGDRGYTAGNLFNSLQPNAFSVANNKWPAHSAIYSSNFNMEVTKPGSYSQESYDSSYENLKYVKGSQGNKGIIMRGPGGTKNMKVFRI